MRTLGRSQLFVAGEKDGWGANSGLGRTGRRVLQHGKGDKS